jgi:hypothetical protein
MGGTSNRRYVLPRTEPPRGYLEGQTATSNIGADGVTPKKCAIPIGADTTAFMFVMLIPPPRDSVEAGLVSSSWDQNQCPMTHS